MKMTKKHYEALAEQLEEILEEHDVKTIHIQAQTETSVIEIEVDIVEAPAQLPRFDDTHEEATVH